MSRAFSYCMETIIQAGNKRLRIGSVPLVPNAQTRESRLFKNPAHRMVKSASPSIRSWVLGVIADLLRTDRILLEEHERIKAMHYTR